MALLLLKLLKKTVGVPQNKAYDNKRRYQQKNIVTFVFGSKIHSLGY
jgi:hypothetical protein